MAAEPSALAPRSRLSSDPFAPGLVAAATLAILLAQSPAPSSAGALEDAIETRISRLTDGDTRSIGSSPIAASSFLADLYGRRGFRAAWDRKERLDALLDAIEDAALDGLLPTDYHAAELRRHRDALAAAGAGGRAVGDLADADLLASDAFVRLAYHLYFGKVDPVSLDSRWNFSRRLDRDDAVGGIGDALESGQIGAVIERLRPDRAIYLDLRRALAAHRDLAARGGWLRIPPGPTLTAGARDPRVATLRARLAASGDLDGSTFGATRRANADTSWFFDPALETAVRAFQRRHLMAEDGTVGPATLAALNVPIGDRIDQIRLNLERGRWVLHHLPDSFVVFNVAAFETYLVVGNRRVWSARCQVGSQARQTPIFRSDMRYLVFNPTWTVPPGILSRDILPPLKRGDLSVLERKKLKVLDGQGREVSPASVKWSGITARNCPYTFRQNAGPDNALGRVKFMFPNSYSVYLHDTPSRDLFDEPTRAFSSGCIRVERPLELAELLLAQAKKWDAEAIRRVVASGTTTTVSLPRRLPVMLLYWTAFPAHGGGRVSFAPDIYKRDGGILKALDAPVAAAAR